MNQIPNFITDTPNKLARSATLDRSKEEVALIKPGKHEKERIKPTPTISVVD